MRLHPYLLVDGAPSQTEAQTHAYIWGIGAVLWNCPDGVSWWCSWWCSEW